MQLPGRLAVLVPRSAREGLGLYAGPGRSEDVVVPVDPSGALQDANLHGRCATEKIAVRSLACDMITLGLQEQESETHCTHNHWASVEHEGPTPLSVRRCRFETKASCMWRGLVGEHRRPDVFL